MKTTNPLSRLFGPNPFSLLKSHMRVVISCTEKLPSLFEAVLAGQQDQVEVIQKEIFRIEAEADTLKREVRQHLPRTILLPVNRADLIDLLTMQDKIAHATQDIAGLDLRMIGRIVMSWIVTLPIAGIAAAIVFFILRAIFG
jgi:predicted phosphate transport protein (TIGR00153 family)